MVKFVSKIHGSLFSEKNLKLLEKTILFLAVSGFVFHLLVIYINKIYDFDFLNVLEPILVSPISSLYTPFSFILLYEVFLLVYYLPRSFTTSIAKEYEIVSLIMIRKIFEDIPNVNTYSGIFNDDSLALFYNLLAIIIIYYLIFLFKKTIKSIPSRKKASELTRFIALKKILSLVLVPILLLLCIYNFSDWIYSVFINQKFTDSLSSVFFVDFFTILILVDVFVLLISFRYVDRYSQIIRNTGFIISTILLRLSFSVDHLSSLILLLSGVLFGLVILKIYQLNEENSI